MRIDAPYHLYESCFQTGSTVICNPPVTTTDEDWMFYTEDYNGFVGHLYENGWKPCGEDYEMNDGERWTAVRKGSLNYLITDDLNYYDKFKEATDLAKKLNLLEKTQRIALFEYIIKGNI